MNRKNIRDNDRMTTGEWVLALAGGAVMAIMLWMMLYTWASMPVQLAVLHEDRLAGAQEKRLMSYHGVLQAETEHDGKMYAYRDGVRFHLWDPEARKGSGR